MALPAQVTKSFEFEAPKAPNPFMSLASGLLSGYTAEREREKDEWKSAFSVLAQMKMLKPVDKGTKGAKEYAGYYWLPQERGMEWDELNARANYMIKTGQMPPSYSDLRNEVEWDYNNNMTTQAEFMQSQMSWEDWIAKKIKEREQGWYKWKGMNQPGQPGGITPPTGGQEVPAGHVRIVDNKNIVKDIPAEEYRKHRDEDKTIRVIGAGQGVDLTKLSQYRGPSMFPLAATGAGMAFATPGGRAAMKAGAEWLTKKPIIDVATKYPGSAFGEAHRQAAAQLFSKSRLGQAGSTLGRVGGAALRAGGAALTGYQISDILARTQLPGFLTPAFNEPQTIQSMWANVLGGEMPQSEREKGVARQFIDLLRAYNVFSEKPPAQYSPSPTYNPFIANRREDLGA